MNSAEVDQLRRKFIAADTADEVLRELERLEQTGDGNNLSAQAALDLNHSGLHALHRILGGDATLAREIIIRRLLPLCVRDAKDAALERNIVFINCRELAGKWINALTGPDAATTREEAIAFLLARLEVEKACLPACWTISEIGYRTPGLTDRLWALVESSDQEKSDNALATLSALGLIGEERQRCMAAALAAARERLPYTITNALVALPDPASIFAIADAWLDRPPAELEAESTTLFSLFAQLGACVTEHEAIDQACVAIAKLLARGPLALGRWVRLGGTALPRLDSPRATELLVNLLAEETTATSYDRWLVMLRLESCCSPRQLEGLEVESTHDPGVLAALFGCVLEHGSHLGRESTLDGQVKIAALKTALLLGAEDALSWLGPAIANEENQYLRHEIMEVYAALRVSPLPDPIPLWIVEEKQLGSEAADNLELMVRLAASRIARSAATPEAFELLARPGLLRKGAVMLETAEGLVAASLAVGSDPALRPRVLERLFDGVERPVTTAQHASACNALAAVARRGWLVDETLHSRLFEALRGESGTPLQAHSRAKLVAAVMALPAEARPEWLPAQLAAWGRNSDALGERSVQALIEMGHFLQNADWLAPKLGLQRTERGVWNWDVNTVGQVEWAPLGIVLLYANAPAEFVAALCGVLRDERWFVRHDVVGLLQRLVADDGVPLLEPVREAIMARVQRRQSSRFADPPLLQQAAMLMPAQFARERWGDRCGDWLDDARTALADALGTLRSEVLLTEPELRQNASAQLLALSRDGQFAVRRSAQRSLGRVHSAALEVLCQTLAESTEVDQRSLAAEAWAWLPVIAFSPPEGSSTSSVIPSFRMPDIEGWARRFAGDESKRVRETSRAAAAARLRRSWAESYLLRLTILADPTNSDLFRNWKLGNALAQTGDDETLQRLRSHLESASLAPSVRFRLNTVAKDLEKNWSSVTKKWPEPSLSLPGGVETFDARLRSREREWAVRCTLWHLSGTTAEAKRIWGGIAVLDTPGDPLEFMTAFGDMEAHLVTGETSTLVAIHGVEGDGLIVFRGSDAYPSSPQNPNDTSAGRGG